MRKALIILVGLLIIGVIAMVWIGFNPLELKLKSGLQVETNDVPTSLFLNDQYLDKAPFFDKKIKPGAYTLRIEPDSDEFATYDLPITLYKGTVAVVNWKPGPSLETSGGVVYEMERLKSRSDIQVAFQTVPDGAIVTFDGGSKQFSPMLMTNLTEGNHPFEVSLPSFETQQHAVNLILGHKVTITVFLGKISEAVPAETVNDQSPETTDSNEEATLTGPRVQILDTNFFVNGQEVLRVRTEPSPLGTELGVAPVGNFYPYLGQATGWYQIEFEDQPGWVSAQFSQKIATDSAQTNQ
jgi:hypothetical protein